MRGLRDKVAIDKELIDAAVSERGALHGIFNVAAGEADRHPLVHQPSDDTTG